MNPNELFITDRPQYAVGWEAITSTQHGSAINARIEQLWREHDDVIERALERGEFLSCDYAEMEQIVDQVQALERELEACYD